MPPTGRIQTLASRFDRLLARLPEPVEARVRDRLGLDLFVVVAVVLIALRLLDGYPWTSSWVDMHTYWATGAGVSYATSNPYVVGAYLYAPAFAQALYPLTTLPWPWFAALWTAATCAAYLWLVGRWAFPLLLSGLLWFAVRREWRNLAIALTATAAFAGVSAVLAPGLWHDWFDLLRRSITDRQVVEGAYLGIPVWLRLPFAVGVITWGARTDRHWTVPIAMLLAMPILWVNVFTLLLAVVPLRPEPGLTPARAWLLRERLLPPAITRKRAPAPQAG